MALYLIVQPTIAIAEKTARLFFSFKTIVSSKPVNKYSSISSKTVVFSDNLSSIVQAFFGPFEKTQGQESSSLKIITQNSSKKLKVSAKFD